jgi:exonuclease III
MSKEITFLQYNTHLFGNMKWIFKYIGLDYKDVKRSLDICVCLEKCDTDIICLEEVWDDDIANDMITSMSLNYQYYYRPQHETKIGCSSGLLFFSKYPIQFKYFKAFNNISGVDYLVSKGYSHIKILVNEKLIDLIFTHTQAPDSWFSYESYRILNIKQIINYIDKHKIHPIILGDLNVIAETEKTHFFTESYKKILFMFKKIGLVDNYRYIYPAPIPYPGYTYTPSKNKMCKYFAPSDNVDKRIDYIFCPINKDIYPIYICTDPENNLEIFKNDFKMKNGMDLSDHYPLYFKCLIKK